MAVLSSTVQPASDSFKENRSSMFELIDHWRSLEQRTIDASNKRLKTLGQGAIVASRALGAAVGSWNAIPADAFHGELLR